MKKVLIVPVALLAVTSACSDVDGPLGVSDVAPLGSEIVITTGVPAAKPQSPTRPSLSRFAETSFSTFGGSTSNPVSLTSIGCTPAGNSTVITVSFSVTGNQGTNATFKVHRTWTATESGGVVTWAGSNLSDPIAVPPQGASATTWYDVDITIVNNTGRDSGNSSFSVTTRDVTNTGSGASLNDNVNQAGEAVVHVAFTSCPTVGDPPAPPSLTLPTSLTKEATSSLGAEATYNVSASYDGDDVSHLVSCSPASGSVFPLGSTTVNCTVTAGGQTSQGDFDVDVEDKTAPVFDSIPTTEQALIATSSTGRTLDISAFGIVAKDWGALGANAGEVSGPASVSCKIGSADADGYLIPIGSTVTVSCTATDQSQYPSPNTSVAAEFDVFVTLDFVQGAGFLSPLRMSAPFSAHKRGSTVPHKIPAPRYDGGAPATDIAHQLRLVLNPLGSSGEVMATEVTAESNNPSTAWRYDAGSGEYIFNLGTNNLTAGVDYRTTVQIGSVILGQTTLGLRR